MLGRYAVRCLQIGLLVGLSTVTSAEKLSIQRLFAAPDLSGPTLRAAKISPDGRLVAYLRGSEQNKDRLDLWAYDMQSRRHRLLVDSASLAPSSQVLSAEEEQRRERQRTPALSGIVEYDFSPDSRYLLVPLGGDLYVVDLQAEPQHAVRRLTDQHSYETDARFSPQGRYVSFIRHQNLVVYELASGTEQVLTREGGGLVSFGSAEFIAQEEMGRTTGYWWAPDERHIAYTRVDESPVREIERFEIYADSTRVMKQRYPAAGTANVLIELFVTAVGNSSADSNKTPAPTSTPTHTPTPNPTPTRIDLGDETDIYLARVNWFPDSHALAVQRQSRDQRTLTLLQADPASGVSRELLTERSDRWVELNDDLTFIGPTRQFIWSSARSGFQHLYLYDWDGNLVRPLTQGEWRITGDTEAHGIRGVDVDRGLVYFVANAQSPLERHLYAVSLSDAAAPMRRITTDSGWHSISMSKDAHVFLDTFSTPDTPPSVTLRSADGSALEALVPNRIERGHPYAPYQPDHLPTEFGTLKASDGETLHYRIIKPRHAVRGHRYPVIVDVYGGPSAQNVRRAWGSAPGQSNFGLYYQYLAQHDYVVFSLDNRGSGSRSVKFATALYHHLGSVEVEDQIAGAKFLRTLPYVDPGRIGVFGWSYGGYMAALCMMQAPTVFAAGVSGAPVTDWRLYDTHYTERYMGTPQDDASGYERSGVLFYAQRLRGPLLIMHGMADDNVLFTNSTTLFKKLQDLAKPFEMMTYPGGKHGLLRHADMGPHALLTIKRFFDRTIGPQAH